MKTLKFSLGIESEVKTLVSKEAQYDQRDFQPARNEETLDIVENNGVLAGEVPEPAEPEAEPVAEDRRSEPVTQDTGPDREPVQEENDSQELGNVREEEDVTHTQTEQEPQTQDIPPKVSTDREQVVNTKDVTQQESVSQEKPKLCMDREQVVNTKDVTQQESVSQETPVTLPKKKDNVRDQEQSDEDVKPELAAPPESSIFWDTEQVQISDDLVKNVAQVLVDLQNVVQVSPYEHPDGSQWPTEEAYKECVDSFHATEEEAEQEPSTYDSNIVPPSQDARPKFQCMPRLPGGFIAESEMEDDDTEHDHTKHLYCEMQDAQHLVYTQVEVPHFV